MTTVVLVSTTHPGNIGACARAMATMGLTKLALASPRADHQSDEALARSSRCEHILHDASVHANLAAALATANVAYGFTARSRNLSPINASVRAAATDIVQQAASGTQVALVFGPEKSGLSNAQLDLCDRLVRIPAASGKPLNLAAAVQIACYELHLAENISAPLPDHQPATKSEIADLLAHLEQVVDMSCPPAAQGKKERMLRRATLLLGRAQPDSSDARMLRGWLTSVSKLAKQGKQ